MIAALLDHLWQSSLFAGLVAVLAFMLRRQSAALRYRLWLLASLKFLLPFAVLAAVAAHLSAQAPRATALLLVLQPIAAKMVTPVSQLPLTVHGLTVLAWLAVLWTLGAAAVTLSRLAAGFRLYRLSRGSHDTGTAGQITVKASATLLEPGLVGLWKPVVLMPAGLLPHLTESEHDAILAHELAHFRRRDNLTAGLHMLVEVLFWFFPPVWLIGARLIAERERACDESVLAAGHDAGLYAGAILKACRFCIRSPLACAPGVTGALTDRIGRIMAGRTAERLDAGRLVLMGVALLMALALPLVSGLTPLAVVRARVAAMERKTEAAVVEAAARVIAVPVARLPVQRLRQVKLAHVKLAQVKLTLDAALPVLPLEEPVPQAAPAPLPVATPPFAQAAPEPRVVMDPKGRGAPDEIVCRARETLPRSRLPGPVICRSNRVWAALYAGHLDFSEDGKALVSHAPGSGCPFTGIDGTQLDVRGERTLASMCS